MARCSTSRTTESGTTMNDWSDPVIRIQRKLRYVEDCANRQDYTMALFAAHGIEDDAKDLASAFVRAQLAKSGREE